MMMASLTWVYLHPSPPELILGSFTYLGSLPTLPLGSLFDQRSQLHSVWKMRSPGHSGCLKVMARAHEPPSHAQLAPAPCTSSHSLVTEARFLGTCGTFALFSEKAVGMAGKISEFRSQLHRTFCVLLSNILNFSELQSFCP